MFKRTYKRPT